MTKEALKKVRIIDAAAERAGGYVLPPSCVIKNPEGERVFTEMRQYSLRTGVPMSKLNRKDFQRDSKH